LVYGRISEFPEKIEEGSPGSCLKIRVIRERRAVGADLSPNWRILVATAIDAMQDHRHLTSEDVLRFLGVGLTLETLRLVIRELLSDCAVCQGTLEKVAQSHPNLSKPL
jgi:hypothetical protein